MAALPKLTPATNVTVTVGCKLPNGIHMDFPEPGKPLRRFTLRGANASRVVGGFGITRDVPKEFFDEWIKQHQDLPAVRNNLIFSMDDEASAEAKAKEFAEKQTGFEALKQSDMGKELTALER